MKRKSGQILILVLLVVVVALAVGLSVASRNITNLRTSTQTEQSQRAFSAAEGGVEDVLSRLSQIASDITVGSRDSGCAVERVVAVGARPAGGRAACEVSVGEMTANVTVEVSNVYEAVIEEGMVGQIDLAGADGERIQIEWGKKNDPLEDPEPASIEVVQVGQSAGSYYQSRTAWKGIDRVGQEGFDSPAGQEECQPSVAYLKCVAVFLDKAPAGFLSPARESLFLRIRPFWTKASVRVTAVGGLDPSLPVQTYDVVSTATTDLGITRRVQVTRTALPALPAAFDYVLFSEGSIVK